jgi:hypothetical protein
LVSPTYAKKIQIFSFASENTITRVLLQKNGKNLEQPVAFMSKTMRGAELAYSIMEKQPYALVQSLKHFRSYIGNSKVIAFLHHPPVKDILAQQDCFGRRGR